MTWLFSQAMVKACASSHCLPGPVAASSAGTCSDGQPSAQLNVMPTQHKFWHNDKTMEPSSLSRFGLTCAVLTEDRGQELLTSYLAGFRARTSVSRGGGAGLEGARSGLWFEFKRIVGEVRPGFVFIENSPALIVRGLATVLADLASLGFDARWGVLSAGQLGACHVRDRAWIVAHSAEIVGAARPRPIEQPGQPAMQPWDYAGITGDSEGLWVEMARKFRGMDDGVAHSVERTEAIGNGQVPAVAASAWRLLGGPVT